MKKKGETFVEQHDWKKRKKDWIKNFEWTVPFKVFELFKILYYCVIVLLEINFYCF